MSNFEFSANKYQLRKRTLNIQLSLITVRDLNVVVKRRIFEKVIAILRLSPLILILDTGL